MEMESNICEKGEVVMLRRRLHEQGRQNFLEDPLVTRIAPLKLCTAFDVPFSMVENQSKQFIEEILKRAISKELMVRSKLLNINTIEDCIDLIHSSRNIVVLTGAGISTSLGIPDFRSSDRGLYSKLESLGFADPQEVFSFELFKEDPRIFYKIARFIYPSSLDSYSPTHAFIRCLEIKNKLLTNYSQNIDDVESIAEISHERLVQCHGSFHTAKCLKCYAEVPGSAISGEIKAGIVARCANCPRTDVNKKRKRDHGRDKSSKTKERKRRRSWEDSDADESDFILFEPGVMKPGVIFFDEHLPEEYFKCLERDRQKADLILIMGTSLKVDPANHDIVTKFPRNIPQIYINLEPVSKFHVDVQMLGECDVVVTELARRLDWTLEKEIQMNGQLVMVECEDESTSCYRFSVSN